MSGKVLLDTNIVIALFGDDPTVKEQLASVSEVFIPSVVIGELVYGAHKSSQRAHNLARIDDFASRNVILGCDAGTALHYGEIKFALQQKGRPIPENDIWIAAIAMQYGLALASRDNHFMEVEDLQMQMW
jgi:tRNA(fMet)-specific endonuclease VapC